jgi:anti-sigma B factor antagonist
MHESESGCWAIELDCDPDAPRAARHALGAWLAHVPEHVRDNALIAIGELVANAVRFGRPPIHVGARVGADSLVIEVSDEGTDRPRRRVPGPDGGIGLNVVYLLATVEIETGRSCVRCTFGTTATSPWSRARPSDPEHYSVELVRQATTLRVLLRGDIDLSARPELDQLLAELDPSHVDRLVIDLREVTFFDSTGLHIAQGFDRWGSDNDVTVIFTRGIPAVMLALRAAGLEHRLTFSDAPEDQPGGARE